MGLLKVMQSALIVLMAISSQINAVNYYVSPIGSDGNPGTLSQPFATIAKARDVVKTINSTMTENISVYLRSGTYFQSSTLVLDQTCSGSNGYNVIFRAYAGERPVISGGTVITGWSIHDAAKNIYKATGINFKFRELYVNGKKATRARTPNLVAEYNSDYPEIGGKRYFFVPIGVDKTNQTIQVASSQISNWSNLTNVEFHLLQMWTGNILRLSSFTTSGSTASLKFREPENTQYFTRGDPKVFTPSYYFFENSYDFIDAAGEWFLDQSAATLYYKPLAGHSMASASCIVPKIETIVRVQGTPDAPAHNIWFVGLTFAHSTYTSPCDSGFIEGQASHKNYTNYSPAAVFAACVSNLRFESNIFTALAATALDLRYGTQNNVISGNIFSNIGGTGVSVGEISNPTDTKRRCVNDSITNNYICNVSTHIQSAVGIFCGYVTSIKILHNEVAWTNYTGVSVGWGWTTNATALSGNLINNNYVHENMLALADGAGIYTLSYQPNSSISGNWINGPLYLDEGSSGFYIINNTYPKPNTPGNTILDNSLTDAQIQQNAGLETAYKNIKNIDVTLPTPIYNTEVQHSMQIKTGIVKAIAHTEYFKLDGRILHPDCSALVPSHNLVIKRIAFSDKSVVVKVVSGVNSKIYR